MIPTLDHLLETHQRVKPFVHRTPVMTSRLINKLSSSNIYFKCENFQRMGAFKMRGAVNAILQLSEKQRAKGVVTHSSGNFAQAVSLAAKEIGIKAYIVMPSSAPKVKIEAVKSYEGEVIVCPPTLEAREEYAEKMVKEKGATFLHPSNDINVILGQGTTAIELLEDHSDLDVVLAPVGGGGLIAGCSLAVHHLGNDCITIGAEPFEADDAYRSILSGKIESNKNTNTIADGLRTQLGLNNFPIIQKHVQEIIRVQEDEIVSSMKLIWERMKIIIEPSCAVPLAAILREKDKFHNKKVGIVLSGGNVDFSALPF